MQGCIVFDASLHKERWKKTHGAVMSFNLFLEPVQDKLSCWCRKPQAVPACFVPHYKYLAVNFKRLHSPDSSAEWVGFFSFPLVLSIKEKCSPSSSTVEFNERERLGVDAFIRTIRAEECARIHRQLHIFPLDLDCSQPSFTDTGKSQHGMMRSSAHWQQMQFVKHWLDK